MNLQTLFQDFYAGNDDASVEIMKQFGGTWGADMINTKGFQDASKTRIEMEEGTDLKKIITAASKGNIDVAAEMLKELHESAEVQYNQIQTLLCGRPATIENFRKIARIIFDAK